MIQNTPEVKILNKENIRRQIQKQEICTKAVIARMTGLSIATCGSILNEMVRDGEIQEADMEESSVGRPAKQYVYNKDYIHVIGMYLREKGDTGEITYSTADALGNVLKTESVESETITFEIIADILEKELKEDPLIRHMTLGIPGVAHKGVIEACDIESLVGVDMSDQISTRFGIDVDVKNDMYFITVGVYGKVDLKSRDIATMYFPDPGKGFIGCGFIVDGNVVQGYTKFAGQLECALEAFGYSRERQTEVLKSRPEFREFVSKIVVMITTVVNPEVIMIMGNGFDSADITEVRENCKKIVNEHHIPRLITDSQNYIFDYYMEGLIKLALDSVQFSVTMREGVL